MEEIGDGAGNGHRRPLHCRREVLGEKQWYEKKKRKERGLGFWI